MVLGVTLAHLLNRLGDSLRFAFGPCLLHSTPFFIHFTNLGLIVLLSLLGPLGVNVELELIEQGLGLVDCAHGSASHRSLIHLIIDGAFALVPRRH